MNPIPTLARDFLWGVANSSFQVEGSPVDSDWKRWTEVPGKIADNSSAVLATDFWNRFEEDFQLAKNLGAKAFRISIAWERIQPKENVWDESSLAHYEKIIESMRRHGLEPIVTLQHFTLPAWLAEKGGLLAQEFPTSFALYAEKVIKRLSFAPARVDYWMTFNEPIVMAQIGYMEGKWPPGIQNDPIKTIRVVANIARAHLKAVEKIRSIPQKNIKVSIAQHWRDFQTGPGFWNWPAKKLCDWVFNRQLVNALMTGSLWFWMPGSEFIHETIALPEGRPGLDYLGINYYGRILISTTLTPPFVKTEEGPGMKSDLGWEIYPEGLYRVLKQVAAYKLPILISENGLADASDRHRGEFLKSHIVQMKKAQSEGIPLIGYLHWSLTDNFEWAYGFTPRFGLVEIDYQTLKRKPRPSYFVYKEIIQNNR